MTGDGDKRGCSTLSIKHRLAGYRGTRTYRGLIRYTSVSDYCCSYLSLRRMTAICCCGTDTIPA